MSFDQDYRRKCKYCNNTGMVWKGGQGGDYEYCECKEGKIKSGKTFLASNTINEMPIDSLADALNQLSIWCHDANINWWKDLETGNLKDRNNGELIALMHSELSEGLEAIRKDKMDDHLPHRKGIEVELADCLIRIFDFAGARKLDLGSAVLEKMAYNRARQDHKLEQRKTSGGKAF